MLHLARVAEKLVDVAERPVDGEPARYKPKTSEVILAILLKVVYICDMTCSLSLLIVRTREQLRGPRGAHNRREPARKKVLTSEELVVL